MPIQEFIMPTYRRFPYFNIRNTASWVYVCGEDIDLTQYSHITTLHVSCYRIPPPNNSNTLPSIATYFPNLTSLIIQNCEMDSPCFIENLTDVPNSLIELYLQGTYITDLTTILTYGTNILSLSIVKNIMPITTKISLPSSMRTFKVSDSNIEAPIMFNPEIIRISFYWSTLSNIYGLEYARDYMICNFTHCHTPYDNNIIEKVGYRYDVKKIAHISEVNVIQTYYELGSIPSRINNIREEYGTNPIVTALCLASNYPRRMIEFVAPVLYNPNINHNLDWMANAYDY